MERYSEKDLVKFGERIKKDYQQAKLELKMLRDQVSELSETMSEGFGADMGEDSSSVSQLELLSEQVLRKRDLIQDLQNAMLRIKNKVYGTCSVTGKLIDRQRLEAIPTTTKSVEGMRLEASGQLDITAQDIARRAVERREGPNKIISKIKKPPPPPRKVEKKRKKPGRKPRKVVEEDDDLI
ncbi:TraR/DksA family transcriptional regulator [Neolewinella persica]|uniref:TraR/DksA family transcriptional regulator n=1 Tax=Neolewinella persica TaxID=70998 RepID=UPI0003654FF2|nr:TraR/DksA C4-type zinc finger protein [Neolewinella persica]